MNGDSGNASQDEHEEDQEHYFEKLQRFKRTENEVKLSHLKSILSFSFSESSSATCSSNKETESLSKMGTNDC